MSVEALTWAFAQRVAPAGRKFVLVALANFADGDWSCFPGQRKLAVMTSQGERTVRRSLAELEEGGYTRRVARYREDGSRSSDSYQLLREPPAKMATPPGQNGHPPRPNTTGLPAKMAGHEPSVNRQTKPSVEPIVGASPDLETATNRGETLQGQHPSLREDPREGSSLTPTPADSPAPVESSGRSSEDSQAYTPGADAESQPYIDTYNRIAGAALRECKSLNRERKAALRGFLHDCKELGLEPPATFERAVTFAATDPKKLRTLREMRDANIHTILRHAVSYAEALHPAHLSGDLDGADLLELPGISLDGAWGR